jgi:DNA-binding winged helix-turn-helix (wHTH) protein/TolB-like protein
MSRPDPDHRFTIGELGEFEFDLATGELRRKGEVEPRRLGPQPAALLGLLIAKQGGVVSREAIREQLWPDVSVDFEGSLHHCVRQIRAAFGERASDANYVETIPKRGYRLKCPALAIQPESTTPSPTLEPAAVPPVRSRSRRRTLAILAGLGALGLLALVVKRSQPEPIRLAILPFEDPEMTDASAAAAGQLGERVLAELTERLGERADVVGPRTTGPLRERGLSLGEIATQLDVAYVVNAKFTGTRAEPALLIELIRSDDGKHVWVRFYDQPSQWEGASAQIIEGIAEFLLAT